MKTIIAFSVVFFSGAVFSLNLSALAQTNSAWEPAWWKVFISLVIAALWTWEIARNKR